MRNVMNAECGTRNVECLGAEFWVSATGFLYRRDSGPAAADGSGPGRPAVLGEEIGTRNVERGTRNAVGMRG